MKDHAGLVVTLMAHDEQLRFSVFYLHVLKWQTKRTNKPIFISVLHRHAVLYVICRTIVQANSMDTFCTKRVENWRTGSALSRVKITWTTTRPFCFKFVRNSVILVFYRSLWWRLKNIDFKTGSFWRAACIVEWMSRSRRQSRLDWMITVA